MMQAAAAAASFYRHNTLRLVGFESPSLVLLQHLLISSRCDSSQRSLHCQNPLPWLLLLLFKRHNTTNISC
jgi:hypothetical protein